MVNIAFFIRRIRRAKQYRIAALEAKALLVTGALVSQPQPGFRHYQQV